MASELAPPPIATPTNHEADRVRAQFGGAIDQHGDLLPAMTAVAAEGRVRIYDGDPAAGGQLVSEAPLTIPPEAFAGWGDYSIGGEVKP